MKKGFLLFIISIIAFSPSWSQSFKAYQKAAHEAAAQQNYPLAMAYYRILIDEAGTDEASNYYEAAEIARKYRSYEKAEDYYQFVDSSAARSQYPLAAYWLGMVQKSQGKYDLAKMSFERYLNTNTAIDSEYADKARTEIENLAWAKEVVRETDDLDIDHLTKNVNTIQMDVNPVEYDGKLFFTSVHNWEDEETGDKTYTRLFHSEESDTSAQLFSASFNQGDRHVSNASFTEDGQRIYYNVCTQSGFQAYRCEIYYRDRNDDGDWDEVVRLPDHINESGSTASQPSIGTTTDGKTFLFFASDRDGGRGGLDIWCSFMGPDGTFSHPFAVEAINSKGDDLTPYWHNRSQTLYLATNGRHNLGGLDIYKSRRDKDGNWAEPKHLGAPVNSSYDDLYYSISNDNKLGYFSSNRPGALCADTAQDCTVCNDIYRYDRLIEIKLLALTFNDITKDPLMGCSMKLIDVNTGMEIPQVSATGNEWNYLLEPDVEYRLVAEKNLYSTATVDFNTIGMTESGAIEKRLYLRPQVDLIAHTFLLPDSSVLTGCTLELFNITLNQTDTIHTEAYTNRFHYPLDVGYNYRITATKGDYEPATVSDISTKGVSTPTTIERDLYLQGRLSVFAPTPLFFDNDKPRPGTDLDYKQTYERYLKRRPTYVRRNSYDPAQVAAINDFFDNRVIYGYNRLEQFATSLIKVLEAGSKIEIVLKGYASPLAPSDYNERLSKRRIRSVEKFFREAHPEFIYYLDETKSLTFSHEPNGEVYPPQANDDPSKPRQSVYSVDASEERKVEIVRILTNDIGYVAPKNK